jgi:FlaA1/EpsC-like NDP-sugar epimerase
MPNSPAWLHYLSVLTLRQRKKRLVKPMQSYKRKTSMRWLIKWAIEIAIFSFSGIAAFFLRFDFHLSPFYWRYALTALPVWVISKVLAFFFARINRQDWHFTSVYDFYTFGIANLAGSVFGYLIIQRLGPRGFPRSIFLLDLMVCFLLTTVFRGSARLAAETARRRKTGVAGKRTLIYGAGSAGIMLLKEIRNSPALAYRVVGFVDDREEKKGLLIGGVPIIGNGEQLKSFVTERSVEVILIAIPSATGSEMTRILEHCHESKVECRTIPGMAEVIEARGLAKQIRQIEVADLLGRNPVHLEESPIRKAIEGKTVLVTGAAGSIGSELCRQIARFAPSRIVGFDIAETPLFEVDNEMRETFPSTPFHAEIGSVQNLARLRKIMKAYRPSVIYHAAAYKHVPLMETHVFEAVENNVIGTYQVALAATEFGVDDFVLISSDKAVRPTNVMGATKRVAELLLLGLKGGPTKFVAVRFGNVLGSSGSVIPIFKKQISAGGPITVTHPEMRRYFMTIPEACQLVLQAGSIGLNGEVCVLDMGEPVKIVDLAKKLILLSGLRPGEDIAIEFSGIRPGEKMCEELSSLVENTIPTRHEKIRVFVGDGTQESRTEEWVESLRAICKTENLGRLVISLREIVLDYSPSSHLLRRMVAQSDSSRSPGVAVGQQPAGVDAVSTGYENGAVLSEV